MSSAIDGQPSTLSLRIQGWPCRVAVVPLFCGHGVGKVFHASPAVMHTPNGEPDVMHVRPAPCASFYFITRSLLRCGFYLAMQLSRRHQLMACVSSVLYQHTAASVAAGWADVYDRAHLVSWHHQGQVLAGQMDVCDDRWQPLCAV